MGVQGLTTFVEGNRYFLQDVRFRDSRLLIDGCSLYFHLYFNHGLDQQYGGDYDAFSCLLKQFLSSLAACNIHPFVVLDGADWEIACLARQWNCPILSNDSDFYIFDLPGGYLPLNHFCWTNLSGKATQRFISARLYTTSALCHWFGGLNTDLLPLCAVLIGNDYGTQKEAEVLQLIEANIVSRGGRKGKGMAPVSRIGGLLAWLSSFSGPAEALAEISQLVDENGRSSAQSRNKMGAVSSKLWACMQEYKITSQSSLALWFSERRVVPRGWINLGLPECLAKSAAQGLLAASVVDALVMKRVLLMPQVENAKLSSSHSSAIYIRQSIYGILHYRLQERLTEENSGGQKGTNEMKTGPECENCSRGGKKGGKGRGPRESCGDGFASLASRLVVLLEVLGVTESALSLVPLHLRLVVAVTIFWQREAKPTPTQTQLHALLIGFVYGELNVRQLAGSLQTHEHGLSVAMVRQRLRPWDKRELDLGDAHSYGQWQACLWAALCLNQLLLKPLAEPMYHAVNKSILKRDPASSSASGRRKKSGRRKRGSAQGRGARQGNKASEEINNRFALLMSEEDDA
ncbi:hypothetical protein WMY93_019530 [Mugilogobius chulae]|uniref:Asteroid domain-containing protein n=1 Tax=Mugilogobius chulae TaxID=88201 RepID=A0AAW0NPC7_9GOBI